VLGTCGMYSRDLGGTAEATHGGTTWSGLTQVPETGSKCRFAGHMKDLGFGIPLTHEINCPHGGPKYTSPVMGASSFSAS
jgi:hypothetical protein